VELGHVQGLVDDLGDGADLCAQLLLDPVEGEPVVVGDQVDRHTQVTEPAGTTNSVQIRLGHLWKVEVDDDIDCLDVDSSREEIRADEVPAEAGPEVVEDSVAVRLGHLGVDVVAGVAELSDLFGQQLHSLGRVAENDALVDLQF